MTTVSQAVEAVRERHFPLLVLAMMLVSETMNVTLQVGWWSHLIAGVAIGTATTMWVEVNYL